LWFLKEILFIGLRILGQKMNSLVNPRYLKSKYQQQCVDVDKNTINASEPFVKNNCLLDHNIYKCFQTWKRK
jgi:hypothetical protein